MLPNLESKLKIIQGRDKRIALVNPSYSSYLYGTERSVKSIHPPLNLLYLHSFIKNHAEIRLFDGETYPDLDSLTDDIKQFDPQIVGYTATSPTYPITKILSKKIDPEVLQVIGGPYATAVPEEASNFFDIVAIGEGEEVLLDLIQNKDIQNINGITFKAGNKSVFTKRRAFRWDLDKLPFPSWDIINFSKYQYSVHRGGDKNSAPIITSRGCPYNCSSCSTRLVNGNIVRNRTPENVSQEMDFLINNYGIKHFHFWDDTFTFDRKRLGQLCSLIRTKNITFSCNTRPDIFKEEDAELLKSAGCTNLFFGVESGNEYILRYFNRRMNKQKILDSFRYCQREGIQTTASFMIGSPYETEETLRETLGFAQNLSSDFVLFNILTPHKGTQIYNTAIYNNILQPYEVDLDKFPEEPVGIPTIDNPHLTRRDLQERKKFMYQEYYGSIKFMKVQIRRAFKRGGFKNLKTALKLRRTYSK